MAEIPATVEAKKVESKSKNQMQVDLTAMVDLAFLLIFYAYHDIV
jgi:hypothetical protein